VVDVEQKEVPCNRIMNGGGRFRRPVENDAIGRYTKFKNQPEFILGNDLRSDAKAVQQLKHAGDRIALVGIVDFCPRAAHPVDSEKLRRILPQSPGKHNM
jgi:hypothetical protein